MFEWISDPQAWISLATLTSLEIVLGVDNIIFLTILVSRLPPEQRQRARVFGLGLAMGTRILLLLSIVWVIRLTYPIFTVLAHPVSGRDLVLIFGGLFLMAKSTHEIHAAIEGGGHELTNELDKPQKAKKAARFLSILIQIAIIDIVFSLDSVITAVGLADHVPIMVMAIMASVLIMMVAAKPIGDFVDKHPTVKMLALSFLILVGTTLFAEGLGFHFPKGYIYFAMAYSLGVEALNLKLRSKQNK